MAPESGVHYAIDPRASQFTVQAFASGLISSVAHSPKIAIREWTGDVTFTPETLRDAKLKFVAKSTSLEVLDELRDSDRREIHRVMNNEVLEQKERLKKGESSVRLNQMNLPVRMGSCPTSPTQPRRCRRVLPSAT